MRLAPLVVGLVGLASGPETVWASALVGAPPAVVVELFTSQGCASCPPADRLLARLGGAGDGRIVPLAFHVDSWNSLGWTDPFSSAEWTRRHEAYVRALAAANVYTPQAVVGGVVEMVGSDERRLRAAVAAVAALPNAEISIAVRSSAPSARVASSIEVDVAIELPEALADRRWDLMIALYETGLVTPVASGENRARELHNDYVVRSLRRAARLSKSEPRRSEHRVSLALASDWRRPALGVAAFLQDPKTMAIRGAAARELEAP